MKKDNTPHGKLAEFFRAILRDSGLEERIPSLIARYKSISTASKQEIKATESLAKDIKSSKMTFNTFITLLSKLLNAKDIKITVSFTRNGKEEYHTMYITQKEEETDGKENKDQ